MWIFLRALRRYLDLTYPEAGECVVNLETLQQMSNGFSVHPIAADVQFFQIRVVLERRPKNLATVGSEAVP